jgi:5-formyltetrahydrofolate cyclo-ligase
MKEEIKEYWNKYLENLLEKDRPDHPHVEVSIAGNLDICDTLLNLYLNGKKTAGSGLVKDYELAADPLPKVGNFWIVLDSNENPRCILKTSKVVKNLFKDISLEIAIAEGEGDLSVDYWKSAHEEFFSPYLADWGIENLEDEEVVTEFYEVVYK